MKRLFTASVLILCLVAAFCFKASAVSDKTRVIDRAELLADYEREELEATLDEINERLNVDVIIVTVNDTDERNIDSFTEYYYDSNGFGEGDTRDGVMLLVNMRFREYRILANGLCNDAISYDDLDDLENELESYLGRQEYTEGFKNFAKRCDYLINGHINGFPFEWGTNLLIALAVGIVVALIATLTMKGQLKSVRAQKNAQFYTKTGSMSVRVSKDLYLYSNVTRVKIQKSSSSGGSGSRKMGGGRF